MLASGKAGEGVYAQDRDISVWQPLPSDDRHVARDLCTLTGCLMDKTEKNNKVSFDMTYSYGF